MKDRVLMGIDEEAVNAHILESRQEAVGRAEPQNVLISHIPITIEEESPCLS